MDFDCPTRRNQGQNRGVKAYLLEADIPEEERLIELDEETFHIYEKLQQQKEDPGTSTEQEPGNDL
jgi:hypothetical protein